MESWAASAGGSGPPPRGDAPFFHVPPLFGNCVVQQPLHIGEIGSGRDVQHDHGEALDALPVDAELLKRMDYALPCGSRAAVTQHDEAQSSNDKPPWPARRTSSSSQAFHRRWGDICLWSQAGRAPSRTGRSRDSSCCQGCPVSQCCPQEGHRAHLRRVGGGFACASADDSQPRRRVRQPIRRACVSLCPHRPQPRCRGVLHECSLELPKLRSEAAYSAALRRSQGNAPTRCIRWWSAFSAGPGTPTVACQPWAGPQSISL